MGNNNVPTLVLSAQKKEGLFKTLTAFVIIYESKTIISYLTPERQKAENKIIEERLKQEKKGFLKSSNEMMRFWAHYHERFLTKSAEEVLAEDQKNFEILHMNVDKVSFSPKRDDVFTEDGSNAGTLGKLKIVVGDIKYEFIHQYEKNQKLVYDLTEIFGEKLKVK